MMLFAGYDLSVVAGKMRLILSKHTEDGSVGCQILTIRPHQNIFVTERPNASFSTRAASLSSKG